MIHTRRIAQLALALAAVAIFAAPSTAAGRISVRAQAEVTSSKVLVGDIATVSGVPDAERDRIASLNFGNAPSPNNDVRYNAAQVKGRLYNAGIAVENYELDIPEQVTIHRKATIVRGSDLIAAGTEFLKKNLTWRPENLVILAKSVPEDIVLPYGDMKMEFEMDNRKLRYGVQSFRVKIFLNGDMKRVLTLSNYLTVMAEVVVAARDIAAGHVLVDEDLEYRKMDLTSLKPGAYDSKEALIGRQIVRPLRRGDVPTHSTISDIPDIASGAEVTIIIRGKGFDISARGKTLEKGYVGETIRVLNKSSRKILDATVVDSETVEIAAP